MYFKKFNDRSRFLIHSEDERICVRTLLLNTTKIEPRDEISKHMVCATSKGQDQPAHMRSLIRAFASRLKYPTTVMLLTERHFEFLKRKLPGSSNTTLLKMPHCWKSHVAAKMSSDVCRPRVI